MPPEIRISAVMAAYTMERWAAMCEAVESLRQQTIRPDEIVIVIDRNEELLERARADWPDVRVVPTRYPGLSGARTTGYEVTSGDLIVFMDDDAVCDPRVLESFIKAVEPDDVLGCTGLVGLQWEDQHGQWKGKPPCWFPEEFLWVLGGSYRGHPRTRSDIRNVVGGIMLIKRKVFDRVGTFNGALGRANGSLISCEETEFCLRASAAFPGGRFVFEPDGKLLHKVARARRSFRYFVRRCYAEGRSKAILADLVSQRDALKTERDYVLRTLTTGVLIGLADPIRRLDFAGPARAGAIVIGLGATVWGYATIKVPAKIGRRQESPALQEGGVRRAAACETSRFPIRARPQTTDLLDLLLANVLRWQKKLTPKQ
jgi:glucosyl-dolichyl phosphate glucuronosyltransferase